MTNQSRNTAVSRSVSEEYDDAECRFLIRELISRLSPRQAEVIEQLFGLVEEAIPANSIAEKQGVSPSRIHQIKNEALRKLSVRGFPDLELFYDGVPYWKRASGQ